ncbi:unnamed protein product [Euphydryas editha]|uniref:Uncharacterized protein n=1 Tax=Euphydryas editha TaxID=104508 RepID=A0AAU9VC91_EUPED|nr:unnamed protein product [Euphydryas editha]
MSDEVTLACAAYILIEILDDHKRPRRWPVDSWNVSAAKLFDGPAGFLKRRVDSESYELSQSKNSRLHKEHIAQKRDDIVSIQPHSAVFRIQSQKETDENVSAASGSTNSTPRKKKLERQLKFCESKIKKQDLKIKRLQSRNRRLKNRANKVEEILKRIEEKFGISEENLDCLRKINVVEK